MTAKLTLWFGCALMLASPAFALTISNLDQEAQTVSVTAGSKTEEVKLDAQKSAEPNCSGGCKVKLGNGEEYQFKGDEKVSIDGGAMFIDHSPDANAKDLPDIDPDVEREEPEEDEGPAEDEDSMEEEPAAE